MKNSLLILLIALGICVSLSTVNAQQSDKELKKEIKDRAEKKARKEAKSLKKEGWKVLPGDLPMDKQLERAWMKIYEEDEQGYPVYLTAEAQVVSETQSGAADDALEQAKLQLAKQLESRIAGLSKIQIANKQLNREDAATIQKTITASKDLFLQNLGVVMPIFKVIRDVGKKNVEALIRIAYNGEMAVEMEKKVVREQLQDEADEVSDELDNLLNWDNLKKQDAGE